MSAIEWTEETLNPWTGCSKVSPGCAHCYIPRTTPLRKAGRRFVGGQIPLVFHMERLEKMSRRRKPTLYFVNSLSDLFHEDASDEQIAQVFAAMAAAPQHTFQILTKRPERMSPLLRRTEFIESVCGDSLAYPLPNVWLGVSIENRRFVHRADYLRWTPAAVRFISAEPLLGDLAPYLWLAGIDWLIAGGESGPRHRPCRESWVRDLRDRCEEESVAFFFKQWGGARPKSKGRLLDGRTWDEMPSPSKAQSSTAPSSPLTGRAR